MPSQENSQSTSPDDEEIEPASIKFLWSFVLYISIYDFCSEPKGIPKQRSKILEYKKDAINWIFSDSLDFNGFLNVCNILGIDPIRIRSLLLNNTREDVMEILSQIRPYLVSDHFYNEDECLG